MNPPKLTYQQAGVDPEKAASILNQFKDFQKGRKKARGILSGIGPYAACFDLSEWTSKYKEPVLVTSCDGVGTKIKLAIEWGNISGLGQDLVAMNVNDVLCTGGKSELFLDYYATGKLRDQELLTLLKGIQLACEQIDCALVGGETAEMPGIYHETDFDLAGFAIGVVEKAKILGPLKVKEGDAIIAMASSGLHSNGFSLVRKVLERAKIKPDDSVPWATQSWRDWCLTPTTLYGPFILPVVEKLSALAHITGGGLLENLPRVLPQFTKAVVGSKEWNLPKAFAWIQEQAGLETRELLSTLNAGVGMLAICPPKEKDGLLAHWKSAGISAWTVGTIAASQEDSASVEWR